MPDDARFRESCGNKTRGGAGGTSHPFGDEYGSLEISFVVSRPVGGGTNSKGAQTSIENAHFWGADTVLIVPGVVDASNSYADVYKRSRESIDKLLPFAEEHKIIIGIEEVWNKFLLSPLEFVSILTILIVSGYGLTSTLATLCCTAIRRIGSIRSASGL